MEQKPTYRELEQRIRNLESIVEDLKQNETRLEALLSLSQMVGISEKEIREFALESIVAITGSSAGYLHFYNEDNQTIDLVSWSKGVLKICTAEKTRHYPLESAGMWADCIRARKPVAHNDYESAPGKKGYPEGHFPVKRHLSVPIFDRERIVAVAGVGNKEMPYNNRDISQTMLFMNSMWTILQQRKAEAVLKRYSMEDGLTGLANRRRFDEVIKIEWRRADRAKTSLSIIMIDIDFFKIYNDLYGHLAGDDCLRKVSGCLRNNIRRAGELITRYGGEEFIAVLPNTGIKETVEVAETFRNSVYEMRIPHKGSEVSDFLTVSAGVASVVPGKNYTAADLIKKADDELYKAKHNGRNMVSGEELG